MSELLFEGADWDFDSLRRMHDAIEEIAVHDLGLDFYPNQIEIISAEQMLDAYSSIGMPLMYRHWSFGKHFIQHERLYKKGLRGLAYEIVINSNPCIVYCMEENTAALQALVIAHAAFGHNHFFKNNHLFRQWTDADGILDYLEYARGYIQKCEEKHGQKAVEQALDSAHALMPASVFRHKRRRDLTWKEEQDQYEKRMQTWEASQNWLFESGKRPTLPEQATKPKLPEENLLYFVECHSPILKPWQREVLRIVRHIGQYFYPQRQTQIMNEGCACFVHYYVMHRLRETGRIDDGAMLEILHNHTNVLMQPDFDDPRFGGINPYALGLAMMQDIRRICEAPTAEDREWFPDFAGKSDWRDLLKEAWANYRDESFIQQFLSPEVIRRFRMFALEDEAEDEHYTVSGIHDEDGYRSIRETLSRSRDISIFEPDIQIIEANLMTSDRTLRLHHEEHNGIPLDETTMEATRKHLQQLWGFQVEFTSD